MSLLTIPSELLGMIIKHLDTKSIHNLYEAGVVRMQGLVTKCQFSMNTLATARSLKSNYFIGVSAYLKVLNLSGVSDLELPSLTDALANMNNLIDLDVTYTSIIMPDFLQIVKARQTLKSIAINFSFDKNDMSDISKDVLSEYQEAFEGFKNVKFVFKPDEDSNGILAVHFLLKTDLSNLKFTFGHRVDFSWHETYKNVNIDKMDMVKLSQFQVYLLKGVDCSLLDLPLFRLMDFNRYEIVVFSYKNRNYNETEVFATAFLNKVISKKTDIEVKDLSESEPHRLFDVQQEVESSAGESIFMFWDKERTKFDNKFYSDLDHIVKEYLLFYFDNHSLVKVPEGFKWYSIEHYVDFQPKGKQSVELDYAVAFKKQEYIQLAVSVMLLVKYDVKPKLKVNNREFLTKLNNLSISTNLRFHSDFFKNIFQISESLVTLQLFMEEDYVDPKFFKHIKKSKSIKNILIEGSETDFSKLFTYLSECRTLENVYLCFSQHLDSLPDPHDLFKKCKSLCNIYIHANMPFLSYAKMLKLYKKVRFDLHRHALNIDINDGIDYKYSPYIGVFNVFQLRPM